MQAEPYAIFNQRLAGWLMFHGFVLVGMDRAKNNTGKNVFFFNYSDDLFKAIQKYKLTYMKK